MNHIDYREVAMIAALLAGKSGLAAAEAVSRAIDIVKESKKACDALNQE